MRTVEECYTCVIARRNELAAKRHKRRVATLQFVMPVCGLSVIAGSFLVARNYKTRINEPSHFVESSTTNIEDSMGITSMPSSSTMIESNTLPETNGLPIFAFSFTDIDDYPNFSEVLDGLQINSFIDSDKVYEYYGIEKFVSNLVDVGFVRNTDSDTPFVIGTLSDGSVVDYNTFCFTSSSRGIEINVDVGKCFEFGQDYYTEFSETQIADIKVYIYRCVADDVYFALFKYKDCSIMVSAKASSIDVDTTKVEGWLFFNTLSTMLGGKYGLGTGGENPS